MVDYKKPENKPAFLCYKDAQIHKLNSLLVEWADIRDKYKQSVLITYWLDSYERFLRDEDKFRSQAKYQKYKRGQVLFVNFGYRIGSELGGNHYAVVLDKKDSARSSTVTVIPLTSKAVPHHTEVSLDNAVKEAIISNLRRDRDQNRDVIEKIKVFMNAVKYYMSCLDAAQDSTDFTAIDIDFCEPLRSEFSSNSYIVQLIDLFESNHQKAQYNDAIDVLDRIGTEVEKMLCQLEKSSATLDRDLAFADKLKNHSTASVSQITTISKLRVINPIRPNDTLSGIRIQGKYLDLINEKMKSLYIY